jgi:UDP-2,3-diacylglucosamine hydrolase
MQRYTLFTSDLHLGACEPEITALFLDFLAKEAIKAEALYILGDLFRLWIGDDYSSPYIEKIKTALKLASKKIPIFLLPGNRDFLLGHNFANESGCILLPDPSIINLYGKFTLITHGDIFCTRDILHVLFRKYILNKFVMSIFLHFPLKLRRFIAEQIHFNSKFQKKIKPSKLMDVSQIAINKALQTANATQIIHGHTHKANIYTFNLDGKMITRFTLGDWSKTQSSSLQIADTPFCAPPKF